MRHKNNNYNNKKIHSQQQQQQQQQDNKFKKNKGILWAAEPKVFPGYVIPNTSQGVLRTQMI